MKKQLLFLTSIFCVMLLQAQMRMPQSNLPRFNRWLNNDEFVINTKLKVGTPSADYVYNINNTQFQFQNFITADAFYQIEKNGIQVDKNCFIDFYRDKLNYPEFNLSRSKIYTQYNLHTITSRPSNTFNGTNYAALNKENGERKTLVKGSEQ